MKYSPWVERPLHHKTFECGAYASPQLLLVKILIRGRSWGIVYDKRLCHFVEFETGRRESAWPSTRRDRVKIGLVNHERLGQFEWLEDG